MGYTHYWYRPKSLDTNTFQRVVADFNKIRPTLEHLGVPLAGPFGNGQPIINDKTIAFNGVEKCGHEKRDLGITWPAGKARGVEALNAQHRTQLNVVSGQWFGGALLSTRTCGGDCSHETFRLEQEVNTETSREYEEGYFNCCKTAYKPYDLAVNVILIIAKHHFGNKFIVRSDGYLDDWRDAMSICQHFLGYGNDFKLDENY